MFSVYLGICLLVTSCIFTPIVPSPIPQDEDNTTEDEITKRTIEIYNYQNVNDGSGNYKFRFETKDGTKKEETGQVVNPGQPDQYIEVKGSYSYRYSLPDREGRRTIYYTAGKGGFNITNWELEEWMSNAIPYAALASLAG